MIDERIPMSSERKHRLMSMPFARLPIFWRQVSNIIDDKCAWCGKRIRETDFIDDEERGFYFTTGYCPMCQAKWRKEMETLETRLGLKPYWSITSFDTKTRNGSWAHSR